MVQRRARRLAVPPTASPTDPLTATETEVYDGAPPIDSKNLFVITTMKIKLCFFSDELVVYVDLDVFIDS